jgi:putative selenium metabolism hydrolase
MNDIVRHIQEFIDREQDSIVRFLSELIETKSITGSEGEAAARVQAEMEDAGFDEVIIDSIGNVVGRIGTGPKTILFDAHIDTVDADAEKWDTNPFEAVLKNGKLYGRGACDCKGPFASILYAGKAIKDLGLEAEFTVYISGSVSEEDCEGLALGAFLKEKNITPDYVVIAEASNLEIMRGHRGRALIEAVFQGTSVHASMHEQGDNPIEKALPFAAAVADLDKKLGKDPVLGTGDISVTRIDTDSVSVNTIPSSCTVIMDRRMTTLDSRESMLKEMQTLPNAEKGEVRYIQYRDKSYNGYLKEAEEYFPAWVLEEDHPLIRGAVDAYTQLFDKNPTVAVWGFSTNGTYTMGQAGIPTVGFGPGRGELAHGHNEYVDTVDLKEAAKFYALLPTVLSGGA